MLVRFVLEEVKHVTLDGNLFGDRFGRGAVWIYWYRSSSGRNCEVPVLSVPGDLPDFSYHWYFGRQTNPLTLATLRDFSAMGCKSLSEKETEKPVLRR